MLRILKILRTFGPASAVFLTRVRKTCFRPVQFHERQAVAFPGSRQKNKTQAKLGLSFLGRLPGIEPELRVPQTPVITFIP